MSEFARLSDGTLVNLAQVVQLTKEGHLQLTSGNTITLNSEDAEIVIDSVYGATVPSFGGPRPDYRRNYGGDFSETSGQALKQKYRAEGLLEANKPRSYPDPQPMLSQTIRDEEAKLEATTKEEQPKG